MLNCQPQHVPQTQDNQQIKKPILISTTGVLIMIFITAISHVFAHASYKCPVNSCVKGVCVGIASKSISLYRKIKTSENESQRFIMEIGVLKILVKSLQNTDQEVHVFMKLQPTSLLKARSLRVCRDFFEGLALI